MHRYAIHGKTISRHNYIKMPLVIWTSQSYIYNIMPRQLSPRVKLATRLYATAAVATKGDAAEAAGLSRSYFYVKSSPKNGHQGVEELMDEVDEALADKTVDMASVLTHIGREAVGRLRELLHGSKNEAIILATAKDLADRSPETSKIQKHQVETFSMSGRDAKELAKALTAAAEVRAAYGDQVAGDFVRVPIATTAEEILSDATGQELPRLRRSDEVDGTRTEGELRKLAGTESGWYSSGEAGRSAPEDPEAPRPDSESEELEGE